MMLDLSIILNPPEGLTVTTIMAVSFILGILHGSTPDEHTWPITFSYSIGKYSTKGGMKAGFLFSLGFTMQRAFLTTLGFLGLAAIFRAYDFEGPLSLIIGMVMAISGSYILKGRYIHLPIDILMRGRAHHTANAERLQLHEAQLNDIPMKMPIVHGAIAGFGIGAYSTIIIFLLTPQVPNIVYAPLPGLAYGLGTMVMQVMLGALFGRIIKIKKLGEDSIKYLGRLTAGRTLYYGGIAFIITGLIIMAFPILEDIAISTGNPIPNLDSIGVETALVVFVVGIVGIGGLVKGIREVTSMTTNKPVSKD
jgi:hypothetical protein